MKVAALRIAVGLPLVLFLQGAVIAEKKGTSITKVAPGNLGLNSEHKNDVIQHLGNDPAEWTQFRVALEKVATRLDGRSEEQLLNTINSHKDPTIREQAIFELVDRGRSKQMNEKIVIAALCVAAGAAFLVVGKVRETSAPTTVEQREQGKMIGVQLVDECALPAHDYEIAGVHPHPSDDSLYFEVACHKPNYPAGDHPKLEFDSENGVLIAHLFANNPQLLKIDPEDGRMLGSIPSDESTMGIAVIESNILCTWATRVGPDNLKDGAESSELRHLDPDSGEVLRRTQLDGLHSSMAPLREAVCGFDGFIALARSSDSPPSTRGFHGMVR